jgi:hypothetical protein
MFELTLGGFDTSQFGETGFSIVYIMFGLAALYLIVVMLNLLIAIISDTFANVQSQAQRKMYQEFAQLICENFHLLSDADKRAYDSKGNYLFTSQIDQSSSKEDQSRADAQSKSGIIQELKASMHGAGKLDDS